MKALTAIASVSSIIANIISCTVTHPLDLIRTRLFFKYHNTDANQNYNGIMQGFSKIYASDGYRGFFIGLTPRIIRKGLGSIICWTFYEYLIDKKDAIIKIGD